MATLNKKRFGLIRIAPLVRWNKRMLWEKIQAEKIPYNKLYDMGYEYVDCMRCTQFHYDSR